MYYLQSRYYNPEVGRFVNGDDAEFTGVNSIAQELWFHALIYYIGMPIQKVFKLIGVSWGWLNDKVARAQYMQINSGDSRAWIFSVFWWAGFVVKAALCKRLPVPVNILAAIVL